MEASRRDSGLIRSVRTGSLATSTICIVVGAGIFAVPGALAASIGPYAPIAILICATSIGSVAICSRRPGVASHAAAASMGAFKPRSAR